MIQSSIIHNFIYLKTEEVQYISNFISSNFLDNSSARPNRLFLLWCSLWPHLLLSVTGEAESAS
jgi:hypothetical protein